MEDHGEIMALYGKVANQNRTLADRDDQIVSLERALAEGHDEIMALHGKVEELWASSSWRLTRPLRGIKLLLTGSAKLTQVPVISRIRDRKVARASEITMPAAAIPGDPLPERDQTCPSVAMLVPDLHDGGLEKVVVDLANQLMKQGIGCPILVAESTGRMAKLAENLGCSVQAFGGDDAKLVSAVREGGFKGHHHPQLL